MADQNIWKAFLEAFGYSLYDLKPEDREAFKPRVELVINRVRDELSATQSSIKELLEAAGTLGADKDPQDIANALASLRYRERNLEFRIGALERIANDVFSAKDE